MSRAPARDLGLGRCASEAAACQDRVHKDVDGRYCGFGSVLKPPELKDAQQACFEH